GREATGELDQLGEILAADQLVASRTADRAADLDRDLGERYADDVAIEDIGVVARVAGQLVEHEIRGDVGPDVPIDHDPALRTRDPAGARDDRGDALHRMRLQASR